MRYQTIKINVCILKTCQVNIRSLTWRGKILAVTKSLSNTFAGPLTVMTTRLDTRTIHKQISAARDPKFGNYLNGPVACSLLLAIYPVITTE